MLPLVAQQEHVHNIYTDVGAAAFGRPCFKLQSLGLNLPYPAGCCNVQGVIPAGVDSPRPMFLIPYQAYSRALRFSSCHPAARESLPWPCSSCGRPCQEQHKLRTLGSLLGTAPAQYRCQPCTPCSCRTPLHGSGHFMDPHRQVFPKSMSMPVPNVCISYLSG